MKRALLLNADYTPLHFIGEHDIARLMCKERVEVVDVDGIPSVWEEFLTSTSMNIPLPATLKLLKRIQKKWKPPRFRKRVLFNRDNWQCQYCSIELFPSNVTIDHVLPSSRGGLTSWTNCVTACKRCNKVKANMTPEEAGMKLLSKPRMPSALHFWDAARSTSWHDDWNYFLRS